MLEARLREWVAETTERLSLPGVAVGVLHGGREHYAFLGVTSVENPLAVNEDTLFNIGSTGKTYTATTIMRLVEDGRVDLHAPVREYVPELRLKDEQVARDVTVLHLLNHTAGWAGNLFPDTGEGDDAIAKYVELMVDLDQTTPLGAVVCYNNAALVLAGRVIEKASGMPYDQAVRELVIRPLGLQNTFIRPHEVMTRRFAIGHIAGAGGEPVVCREWAFPRCIDPAGGILSNAADQIAWARFHLGDTLAPAGNRVLTQETLQQMQQPTADTRGAHGDHVGISWFIEDVEGVRLVFHGGDGLGQHAGFVMAPEHQFAVICLTNGPDGPGLREELRRWTLQHYLGITVRDPEPADLSNAELAEYAGVYESVDEDFELTVSDSRLLLKITEKSARHDLGDAPSGDAPHHFPVVPLGLLPGAGDRHIITDGPYKGTRGYFTRDASGALNGLHFGGLMLPRARRAPG